jgi:hypothetical protein
MEWRIFFIGPMGNDAPAKKAVKTHDYHTHLPKLSKYLVEYLKINHGYKELPEKKHVLTMGNAIGSISLRKGKDKIIVLNPFNLYGHGSIPETVFDAIDDADLIIADLSGNKPAVIYELAFTHALGIETILVGAPETRNFYLSQTKFVNIDFQADSISSTDLGGAITSWLKNRNKRFEAINPLQQFYGAPLPDISAANGLAAGYYDNFARPILTGGKIVFCEPNEDGVVSEKKIAPKGFIVLRPENLSLSIRELEEELEKRLIAHFSNDEVKRGRAGVVFIETENGQRLPFCVVKDYLIDVPRTIFTLAISPRLNRSSRSQSLSDNMQGVLIGRFFENIKKYLAADLNIKERRKFFHFGPIEEITTIIETGKSGTWT